MANPLFGTIRVRAPKKNKFNLSHDVKLTAKFGKLTPILCQDVLPGDTFKLNTELFARFAPLKAPVMHRVNIYTHFFFVPKRLVWDNWNDFITGGESGEESPIYPRVRIEIQDDQFCSESFCTGSLADYLGFPVTSKLIHDVRDELDIDILPFRAYQLIYNEYYRDQNVSNEIDIEKDKDGIVAASSASYDLFQLRDRAWQKDYFTSALPFAQRGDEVELPLSGTGDVIYRNVGSFIEAPPITKVGDGFLSDVGRKTNLEIDKDGYLGQEYNGDFVKYGLTNEEQGSNIGFTLTENHLKNIIQGVDLSHASSATINELRRAIKAQEFLELSARAGSRYIEQIYAYFGVRSSDARLQRPQFLGGGKSPVVIGDVLQTSQTTDTSAQATPAGTASSYQSSHSFKFTSEEHGYIIGIMSIMPKPAYQQGLSRLFSKFDRLDYYWPQFAHLGEQEIKNKEIYVDLSESPTHNQQEGTFGYAPRYAEYKFCNDSVHGDFRESLSFWHMGRIFERRPALNNSFLTNVSDAANRVFAVVDDEFDKVWINIHHNLKALRPMPKYGTPLF